MKRLFVALAVLALPGCAPNAGVSRDATEVFMPEYLGSNAQVLDGDLISVNMEMKGARNREDLAAYGRCAIAQFALGRGYGFARHVRTNVEIEAGVWRGDAVYTISAALPRGLQTIDAEVAVADCEENGIPTV